MIFKELSPGDYQVRTFEANRHWVLNQADSNVYTIEATQVTNSAFYPDTDPSNSIGYHKRTAWDSVNHLYYKNKREPYKVFGVSLPDKIHRNLHPTARIISVSQTYFGERIKPGTVKISDRGYELVDDTYGNIYDFAKSASFSVSKSEHTIGNVFYEHGNIVVNASGSYELFASSSFVLQFKSTQRIFEYEVYCTAKAGEFNYTMNPTALSSSETYTSYGANILKNGSFNDFTFKNDSSTVGLWIFDDVYNELTGGIDYVGEDYKDNGATLGPEVLSNNEMLQWTNNNNLGAWTEVNDSGQIREISRVSGSVFKGLNAARMKVSASDGTTDLGLQQNIALAANTLYRVRYLYNIETMITGDFRLQLSGSSGFLVDESFGIPTKGWVERDHFVYVDTGSTYTYRYNFRNQENGVAYAGLSSVVSMSNGNHLAHTSSFNPKTAMTGSSPVYNGGNVLQFDGVNDTFYILSGSATDFNFGTGDFTVESWVKCDGAIASPATRYGIATKGSNAAGDAGWTLMLRGGSHNGVFVRVTDSSNSVDIVPDEDFSATLNDGNFHYVAYVHDSTNNSGSIFIDGRLVSTGSISAVGSLTNNPRHLRIGANHENGSNVPIDFFSGSISQILISNTAKSGTQIVESYGVAKNWKWSLAKPVDLALSTGFSQSIQVTDNLSGLLYDNAPVEVAKTYQLEGDIIVNTGTARVWDSQTGVSNLYTASVHFTKTIVAGGTAVDIHLRANTAFTGSYDNITLREVINSPLLASSSMYQTFITASDFAPYVTTIGLYDQYNNLLVVGKLARAIRNEPNLGMTFVVRFDA